MFFLLSTTAAKQIEATIADIDRGITESQDAVVRALKAIESESSDIAKAKTLRAEYVALLNK